MSVFNFNLGPISLRVGKSNEDIAKEAESKIVAEQDVQKNRKLKDILDEDFECVSFYKALKYLMSNRRNVCVVGNYSNGVFLGYTVWENLYNSFNITKEMLEHEYFLFIDEDYWPEEKIRKYPKKFDLHYLKSTRFGKLKFGN